MYTIQIRVIGESKKILLDLSKAYDNFLEFSYLNICQVDCKNLNLEFQSESNFSLVLDLIQGWWKYDSRATEDIEEAFQLNLPEFDLIICGELYVIDLTHRYQYPKADPGRKRSIKRDKVGNLVVKGVAGLK